MVVAWSPARRSLNRTVPVSLAPIDGTQRTTLIPSRSLGDTVDYSQVNPDGWRWVTRVLHRGLVFLAVNVKATRLEQIGFCNQQLFKDYCQRAEIKLSHFFGAQIGVRPLHYETDSAFFIEAHMSHRYVATVLCLAALSAPLDQASAVEGSMGTYLVGTRDLAMGVVPAPGVYISNDLCALQRRTPRWHACWRDRL